MRITVDDLQVGTSRRVWTDAIVELGAFALDGLDRALLADADLLDVAGEELLPNLTEIDELPGVRATAHELVVPDRYVHVVAAAAADLADWRAAQALRYSDRGDPQAADVHRPAVRILRTIETRLTEESTL